MQKFGNVPDGAQVEGLIPGVDSSSQLFGQRATAAGRINPDKDVKEQCSALSIELLGCFHIH